MDFNKVLNTYKNPELDHYLGIKKIFSQRGFKIPTAFSFSKRFDKDNTPLFYFFDYYGESEAPFLRIGVNSIPVFLDDTLEVTSMPSNTTFELKISKLFSSSLSQSFGGILGFINQKNIMDIISKKFKKEDTFFVFKLKEDGNIRKKYESIIDTNRIEIYLQQSIFLSSNFFKNHESSILRFLDSKSVVFNDFNLDNLLHLKVLYYDSLNKNIDQFNRIKTQREKDLFLKSLISDAVKRGSKLERVYKYSIKLLTKDRLINQGKDFTFFKFI